MIKEIKQQFFALRNGIIADLFRKAEFPYTVVFGLQLPQLTDMARNFAENHSASELSAVSDILLSEKNVRESRLLAFCLLHYIKEEVELNRCLELCRSVQTQEEADILAFRLLRHLPYSDMLYNILNDDENEGSRRSAISLKRFL
ncbi:MAG: DNA alkylation repair protein [Muribaculaceae bacterium]|nr:DNA alkylation repair protein [Muribaculaceae bacterium]